MFYISRCIENNCNAAFTTKQCLQFHYKKVHGYTEEMMPKIKRSVDYTFEAYSGGDDIDKTKSNREEISTISNLEETSSDVEDNGMILLVLIKYNY